MSNLKISKSVDFNTSEIAMIKMDDMDKGKGKEKASFTKQASSVGKNLLFKADPLNVWNDIDTVEKLIDMKRCEFKDSERELAFKEYMVVPHLKQHLAIWAITSIIMVFLAVFSTVNGLIVDAIRNGFVLVLSLIGVLTSYYGLHKANTGFGRYCREYSTLTAEILIYIIFLQINVAVIIRCLQNLKPLLFFDTVTFFILCGGLFFNVRIKGFVVVTTILIIIAVIIPPIFAYAMDSDELKSFMPEYRVHAIVSVLTEFKSLLCAVITIYRIKISQRIVYASSDSGEESNRNSKTFGMIPTLEKVKKKCINYRWYIKTPREFNELYTSKMASLTPSVVMIILGFDLISGFVGFFIEERYFRWVVAIKCAIFVISILLTIFISNVMPRIHRVFADPRRITIMAVLLISADTAAFCIEFIAFCFLLTHTTHFGTPSKFWVCISAAYSNIVTAGCSGLRVVPFLILSFINVLFLVVTTVVVSLIDNPSLLSFGSYAVMYMNFNLIPFILLLIVGMLMITRNVVKRWYIIWDNTSRNIISQQS